MELKCLKIGLIFLSLFYFNDLKSQDSLQVEKNHFGIYSEIEFTGRKLVHGDFGKAYQIGAFHEVGILDRVNLTTQIGFRHKNYAKPNSSYTHFDNSDTLVLIDRFDETRISNRVAAGLGFNFNYIQNDFNELTVYLGLAYLSEYLINNGIERQYVNSRYLFNNNPKYFFTRNNPRNPDNTNYKFVHNFSMMIGVTFKRIKFEVFIRSTLNKEKSNNVGFLFGYYLNKSNYKE